MAYFNNLIGIISRFYPTLLWQIPNKEKIIYLTFDDGPLPEITDFVLSELKAFQAEATFFCVGDNVRKNPQQFLNIVAQGHSVGNHTFHHLKGWDIPDDKYLENVLLCQEAMMNTLLQSGLPPLKRPALFRPPYGKIKKSQIALLEKEYKIVMWRVLTGDFDKKQSPQKCLKEAIRHTKAGSIVIFHDSLKAETNLRYALPRYLEHFKSLGYRFKSL